MCSSSPSAAAVTQKDPVYLHNKWLDTYSLSGSSTRTGRNSLRIDTDTTTNASSASLGNLLGNAGINVPTIGTT